jgi:hypothetical protein
LEFTSVFDLAFMLLATVLTMLSLNTLQMLARIGMDRSLFIPVMVSAAFFWYGSITSVVFDILLESTPSLIVAQDIINLLRQVTWLIGLGILTSGVFSYWKITKQVKVPKHELPLKQDKDEEEKS